MFSPFSCSSLWRWGQTGNSSAFIPLYFRCWFLKVRVNLYAGNTQVWPWWKLEAFINQSCTIVLNKQEPMLIMAMWDFNLPGVIRPQSSEKLFCLLQTASGCGQWGSWKCYTKSTVRNRHAGQRSCNGRSYRSCCWMPVISKDEMWIKKRRSIAASTDPPFLVTHVKEEEQSDWTGELAVVRGGEGKPQLQQPQSPAQRETRQGGTSHPTRCELRSTWTKRLVGSKSCFRLLLW